jgi:hypothetical protein
VCSLFRVRGSHPLWLTFPSHSAIVRLFSLFVLILQPLHESLHLGLGFSHFARHYFGNILFSSGYLDVSVPRVPFLILSFSYENNRGSLCWVSPFGYSGIGARSQLPQTFRSVPRPSSALSAKASSVSS